MTVLASCSTKKNTFMSRNYHNLVSHYNGYFNAREILKAENKKLIENHKDDYSQVLPIFIYPTEEQSKALIPQMDIVIEKSSKVIERHSIYHRKKEHVKWIDDTYYLVGQAQFNKGLLVSAEETFLYLYQAFKKEPIRYDGLLWLIRTLIQQKDWEKVDTYTRLLEDDVNFPKEKEGLYNAIYADYLLKKDKDVEKAIPRLEEAVKLTDDKRSKRRYTYILAQLYQKKGYLKKANDLYADVLKLRPDYVMAFNCKINRAIAYDVASNNAEDIKKQLKKMLKDSKNEEFFDQIYYALAELAITQKDEPLAVQYLKKSAQVSTVNVKQKALSYYKLAGIYFNRPDYINAQAYYDSTTIYLPKDHEAYFLADEKNKSLLELVKNLKIVQLQDSLLKISNLSEKEQKRLVNDLIAEYKSKKERERLAEEAAQFAAQNGGGSTINIPGGSSSWYFYNPTSMAFGMSEFKRQWGDRKLQDDWRRSNKQSAFPEPGDDGGNSGSDVASAGVAAKDADPNLDQDTYLKNIPKDYNEKLIAHGKVVEALYNIGLIFKESFEDFPSGINAFERIVEQYDTSQLALPAHYQLYRIYLKQEEKVLAEKHKDWVLENHPFSEYAYIIKNPNYNKQTKATKEKVESFYTATYRLYEYGLYRDVISSCEKADSVFNSDHLKAKFDYLRAKAIGKVRSIDEFKTALKSVIADHPDDPVKEQAQSILDYINKNSSTPVATSIKNSYVVNPEDGHIVLVEVNSSNNKNDNLKNQIAIFNQQFFRNDKFDVSKILIGGNQNMLMIRSFDNKAQAMNYYSLLTRTSDLAEIVNGITYVITNENLRTLFKEKNLSEYITFFNANYKK
ncbi:type IX secretion system periplasmic lipoprotein PorW/SprE [Acidiluteibacter ferrifornacis]